MNNEKYLVTNIPFENDLNDKCGNVNFTITGNPEIKDVSNIKNYEGKCVFDKAVYFDGNSYMISSNTIEVMGKDFTMIGYFYLPFSNLNKYYSGNNEQVIFSVARSDTDRCNLFRSKSANAFRFSLKGYNDFTISEMPNDIFNHVAYCYISNENTWYVYVNGILKVTKTIAKSRNNYYISLGGYKYSTGRRYYGYIRNFRIYDGIALWTEDSFDLKQTYELPKIEYNTIRSIKNKNYISKIYKAFSFN